MTDDGNGSGRRSFPGMGDDHETGGAPEVTGGSERILHGLPRSAEGDDLAPVIPLFGSRGRSSAEHPSMGRDSGSATDDGAADAARPDVKRPRLRPLRNIDATVDGSGAGDSRGEATASRDDGPDEVAAMEEVRQSAEAVLLRKLRSRSLSISEARGVVRGAQGADDVLVEEIIDRFIDLGYLDDATFAEQLAMSAVEKRGEGRRAVAETLRKRGIPRDVAEVALAALPDDDAERALEFARSKVRGVEGVEYEAALRRLGGQLARRGYPSSVALAAARAALQEAGIGRSRSFARPASGVRFSPDE